MLGLKAPSFEVSAGTEIKSLIERLYFRSRGYLDKKCNTGRGSMASSTKSSGVKESTTFFKGFRQNPFRIPCGIACSRCLSWAIRCGRPCILNELLLDLCEGFLGAKALFFPALPQKRGIKFENGLTTTGSGSCLKLLRFHTFSDVLPG